MTSSRDRWNRVSTKEGEEVVVMAAAAAMEAVEKERGLEFGASLRRSCCRSADRSDPVGKFLRFLFLFFFFMKNLHGNFRLHFTMEHPTLTNN